MSGRTRRRFLAGTAVLCGALAGCVGDDTDDSDQDNTDAPDQNEDQDGDDDQNEGDDQAGDDDQADQSEEAGADDDDVAIGEELDRPSLGDEDAPVTVTVYDDFSCPACRVFKQDVLPKIVEEYVDSGAVQYRHGDLPIPVDETWSWAVPSAARELYEAEGDDVFWAFSAEIFEQQGAYSYDVIETVAEDVAGMGATAREAGETEAHRGKIEVDRERAIEMGATGTPAVFVDGELVDPSYEAISAAIEDRLSTRT